MNGTHEFECTGPVDARIQVRTGDVTVTTVDQPVAVVTITPEGNSESSRIMAANTTVTFDHGRLEVRSPATSGGWLGIRRGIRVAISLPHDSIVTAQLGSADLRADGRLASVTTNTGSGDVFIPETSGDVAAESGSGDLHLGRIGGALRAHTSSGDVSATDVRGDAVVSVASGDVMLGSVGGALQARTASGDVRVSAVHGREVGIDAASGDVTVGVPAGTSVWLDLSSVSGSTRNTLTPTGEPDGGPALTLRVRTISGDIQVRRAA